MFAGCGVAGASIISARFDARGPLPCRLSAAEVDFHCAPAFGVGGVDMFGDEAELLVLRDGGEARVIGFQNRVAAAKLGFVPEHVDPTHAERWRAVEINL